MLGLRISSHVRLYVALMRSTNREVPAKNKNAFVFLIEQDYQLGYV